MVEREMRRRRKVDYVEDVKEAKPFDLTRRANFKVIRRYAL